MEILIRGANICPPCPSYGGSPAEVPSTYRYGGAVEDLVQQRLVRDGGRRKQRTQLLRLGEAQPTEGTANAVPGIRSVDDGATRARFLLDVLLPILGRDLGPRRTDLEHGDRGRLRRTLLPVGSHFFSLPKSGFPLESCLTLPNFKIARNSNKSEPFPLSAEPPRALALHGRDRRNDGGLHRDFLIRGALLFFGRRRHSLLARGPILTIASAGSHHTHTHTRGGRERDGMGWQLARIQMQSGWESEFVCVCAIRGKVC